MSFFVKSKLLFFIPSTILTILRQKWHKFDILEILLVKKKLIRLVSRILVIVLKQQKLLIFKV